ncbi:MAG TPA: prephenate dehydrogenase/arogenate dehydrogenase family protein [Pirellulales bacterium]|jgi:prephenate dehydrogenase
MPRYDCVAISGVGLIGGSVGLALGEKKLAREIVGFGSRPATLEAALAVGAITRGASDVRSAVAAAQVVVVCAPVGAIVDQVRQIAPHCSPGTLITDAGSTKAEIVAAIEQLACEKSWPAGVAFVGAHPLAGNDKRGPQHADATLFAGRLVVITPTSSANPQAVRQITDFWQALGAITREMSPEEHDRALSMTSHLPHLLAACIASATPAEFLPLTASGWQDTTRIAGGDPAMWRQIMLANRENLLAAFDRFVSGLDQWRRALETADGPSLENLLAEAKRVRDSANGPAGPAS